MALCFHLKQSLSICLNIFDNNRCGSAAFARFQIGVFKPRAGEEESSMIPSYLMRIVIIEINMIEHEVPDYC